MVRHLSPVALESALSGGGNWGYPREEYFGPGGVIGFRHLLRPIRDRGVPSGAANSISR